MSEERFEDFEKSLSDVDISEDNLLTKIWLKPTSTLKYIIENCPEKYVTLFLVLGGIVSAIDRASSRNLGDSMSTLATLAIAIIFGGLFGWITYYIYAWGMSVTGEWLGGNSKPAQFRTIIAWALVPSICSLILLVPEIIIFGDDLFRSGLTNESLFNTFSLIGFGVIELALGIWTTVILVIGINIIQNFGIGKSVLNMILPGLLIIVPIIVIALLFGILS